MSGYLGSIGFGYPAALGAWAAAPPTHRRRHRRRRLRSVPRRGDDRGQVRHPGAARAARQRVLGKISKEQRAAEYDVWQTSLHNPDFAAFASLCGATGIAVDNADDLDDAFSRLFATDGPATVSIRCDPELI